MISMGVARARVHRAPSRTLQERGRDPSGTDVDWLSETLPQRESGGIGSEATKHQPDPRLEVGKPKVV